MATIVRQLEDSEHYVLLGTGFGMTESTKPHWLFGNLGYQRRSKEHTLACICDRNGELCWTESDQLVVVSVDGVTPQDALATFPSET